MMKVDRRWAQREDVTCRIEDIAADLSSPMDLAGLLDAPDTVLGVKSGVEDVDVPEVTAII